ncbi:hypothetical protein CLV98_11650 [Dyadobacter jejuensis]|uniref:Uncharacterized protein n=1 Tax=Dyadobacter jejuensis TaxID=1082580 RepID=A0A316AAP2_9BACT|nr:hypothetical protein [Dyadobacter jejuensis]PWJ54763.1 hypothetical protein CLV98_11650 [Dyadobacter jejuensis]
MRNIAANAMLNLRDQPASLFVHGSVLTFRMDDRVVISRVVQAGDEGERDSLRLVLVVAEGTGPYKGTAKSFVFETTDPEIRSYQKVHIRYGLSSLVLPIQVLS